MVFKDLEMLAEAYKTISEKKCSCQSAAKGCDCDGCKDCKHNHEKSQIEEAKKTKKPDKDGDGVPDWADKESSKENKKEKPAFLKKEGLTFKDLFNKVISEKSSPFSPEPINPHLDSDRKKLAKMRKEKEEAKKKKAKE